MAASTSVRSAASAARSLGVAATVTSLACTTATRSAYACTVCFGGQPNDWTGGFFLGTLVMLSLPPLIVVGAGLFIYRAIKRQEARVRERDAQRAREALQHGAS